MVKKKRAPMLPDGIEKCPTGITGLDEITEGGLPRGRPTLVCGGAGSGKTLLAMEFLVRGITEFDEPGVFVAFEETAEELAENVSSLGFDVKGLIARKKLGIDHIEIERSEYIETGEFDLEGLFVRINWMIEQTKAKRLALDTIEALFAGMPNEAVLRAELRRLFRWLKDRGVTAIITSEQGKNTLTRYGIEEYVSDCVIFLDHRVRNQIATRRLRIVKYRGSKHGTNEYPTVIDENGLSVLPISSLALNYPAGNERISSGLPWLDDMMGGKGYFRGSSILVSGGVGTGKTSVASSFVDGICRRGAHCVYISLEESPAQIVRNMQSIGIDLGKWQKRGLLTFNSVRPTFFGLETHLAKVHRIVDEFNPAALVMDPITSFSPVGEAAEIRAMLTRIMDLLKRRRITTIYTNLTTGESSLEGSEAPISSLIDTWLVLSMVETKGERSRFLHILKSRGMVHSLKDTYIQLTDRGIQAATSPPIPGRDLPRV